MIAELDACIRAMASADRALTGLTVGPALLALLAAAAVAAGLGISTSTTAEKTAAPGGGGSAADR